MHGSHIDRSKKTIGVIAAIVFALIIVKCGCNRVGFADPSRSDLAEAGGKAGTTASPITLGPVEPASERGAGRARPFNVDDDGNLVSASSTFILRRFRVTAYCPGEECCWPHADGITASGHAINPGDLLCAADPDIPFGTRILIPGYSKYPVRVLDRGGDIKGNRLDVLFYDGDLETSYQKAIKWGVKIVNCKLYIGNSDGGS